VSRAVYGINLWYRQQAKSSRTPSINIPHALQIG
jgi:hypothetical protein